MKECIPVQITQAPPGIWAVYEGRHCLGLRLTHSSGRRVTVKPVVAVAIQDIDEDGEKWREEALLVLDPEMGLMDSWSGAFGDVIGYVYIRNGSTLEKEVAWLLGDDEE